MAEGSGDRPADGQEVVFDYVAYNESGVRIDSSYNKGRAASVRLGVNGLIPGAHCSLPRADCCGLFGVVSALCCVRQGRGQGGGYFKLRTVAE